MHRPHLSYSPQVMHASVAVFRALKGSGYARADFRVGPGGDAFFLELNPNAGVLYPCDAYASADHVLQHDPLGHKGASGSYQIL